MNHTTMMTRPVANSQLGHDMARETDTGSAKWNLHLILLLFSLLIVMALLPARVFAQHVMTIGSNSAVEVETLPANDEILETAPVDLVLRFSTYVRLVKLVMKAPGDDPVNIGFRYAGEVSRVFLWNLPELPAADYYTVEWAAIDPDNQVARGSFSFSFGPNARPASELIPEEEILAPVIVPDFRLIDQSTP